MRAQARRADIGPVRLDVFQGGGTSALAESDPPAVRDRGEAGPERVLLLVVDQDQEGPVLVVERIHGGVLSSQVVLIYVLPVLEADSGLPRLIGWATGRG